MIDYASIPQANELLVKLAAIRALPFYAAVAHYALVIAPATEHVAPHHRAPRRMCRRGWCRLEMWSRLAVGGDPLRCKARAAS